MKDDKLNITLTFNNHEHRLRLQLGNEEEERLYREAAELIKNTIRKYRNMAPGYSSESVLELAALEISYKYGSLKSDTEQIKQWGDAIDKCIGKAEN